MTKTCVICKKQPIPHDKTRSFHKFPINPILKSQWMFALKLSNVTNNSRVCSDHFLPDSYHETDNYRTLKRLLSDAVPFLEADKPVPSVKSELELNNTTDVDESIREKEDQDISILESTNVTLMNYNEDNVSTFADNEILNPEQQCILKEGIDLKLVSKKKIRFMDGFQTKYISRTDFVSKEAWYRFLKLLTIKNSQIKASQKKSARREEKLLSYKQLIKNLADKKVTIAPKYLQDID